MGCTAGGTRPGRPPMRAIVLYPMNALVNDQLRRLRKTLASDAGLPGSATTWPATSSASVATRARPSWRAAPEERRRERWEEYVAALRADWESVGEELRALRRLAASGRGGDALAAGTCRRPRRTSSSRTTRCWSTCS